MTAEVPAAPDGGWGWIALAASVSNEILLAGKNVMHDTPFCLNVFTYCSVRLYLVLIICMHVSNIL